MALRTYSGPTVTCLGCGRTDIPKNNAENLSDQPGWGCEVCIMLGEFS